MGIETTYNQLSSQIKRDNKKRNRTENIMGIASVAAASYQKNLKKEREELLKSSELNNKKVRRQAGLDLYTNKYKTLYEQGTQSLGGLRTFLIDGKATEIAKQKLDAEVREGRIANPDEYNKIVRSYATEMVDGSKREGEDPQKGMLESLTSAYNKGKTLKSTEEYERFLVDKADLPENAGVAIVNKIFGGKNKTQINEDALKRIAEENDFDKNLAAFEVLDTAFNAGAGFAGAESLAKQYIEQAKKQEQEFINVEVVKEQGYYQDAKGNMVPVAYTIEKGIDKSGKKVTLPNTIKAIEGNDLSKRYIESIAPDGKPLILTRLAEQTTKNLFTGGTITSSIAQSYYATGEKIGQTVIGISPPSIKEIEQRIASGATITAEQLEQSKQYRESFFGSYGSRSDEIRTSVNKMLEVQNNLKDVDTKEHTEAVAKLHARQLNSLASIIKIDFDTGVESAYHIANQLMYDNSRIDNEDKNYSGIYQTNADKLGVNSYRVFEAINELHYNSNFNLEIGLPDTKNQQEFNEAYADWVEKHMVLNGSEKGARSIQGWGAETNIHFRNTNSTRLESTETSNDTNIWNVTVPHPDGSGDLISLYDRYLIITKQDKAPIVAEEKKKKVYLKVEKLKEPDIELQNTLSSNKKVKNISKSLKTLKEAEGGFLDLASPEEGLGTRLLDGKIRRNIKSLSTDLIKLNSNSKMDRQAIQSKIDNTVKEMKKYRETTDTTPGQENRRETIENLYSVIFSTEDKPAFEGTELEVKTDLSNFKPSVAVDSIVASQTPDETVEDMTPSFRKNGKIVDIQYTQPEFNVEKSPISDEEIALRGLSRQEYNELSPNEVISLNNAILKSRKDRLKQLKTSVQSQ
tara:strand:- start:724 stop:3303 length:2580 start_codon:yes stop_codon:yes gene_type:complete